MTQEEILKRLKESEKNLANVSAFINGWFVGDFVNLKFELANLIERFEHFVKTGEME